MDDDTARLDSKEIQSQGNTTPFMDQPTQFISAAPVEVRLNTRNSEMRSQKNTTPINIEDIQSLDEVCKMKDDLESLKASVIRQMDSIKANENSFLMQKPYTSYS